jgi:glutaminase
VRFSIQSIIKPMLLLLALMDNGEEYVRRRVGVESTGKPFDAINISDAVSQEILSEHINPMVNMGAIVMTTLIKGENYKERFDRLLELTRKLANNPEIDVDEEVYLSEKATGNKNRALAFLMRSCGLLDDDVEEVLDCYFRACSIRVDCRDLARIAFVLSNKGRDFLGNELFPARYAHYVNAVMLTCGMYDGAGDFAVTVGVPAKSGVGGGIMAVVPGRMGIGIYSPALDKKGNSVAGIRILRELSKQLQLSIF